MSRFSVARPSLLATIFTLYCVPVIHAAAIASSNVSPNSPSLGLVARGWISALVGPSDFDASTSAEGLAVSATATDATAYLRIASLSIALYDFLMTIPGEYRLYAAQPSILKMSRACILFILVRYVSVAALITSNYGFFGTGFSANACKSFYLVAPILKVFAVLFSQLIVSVRTFAISRKEPWVLYLLSALFVVCMVPEFLGNAWERIPVQNTSGNCTSGNTKIKAAWLHYLAAMVFDAATMGISTAYLIIQTSNLSLMSGLSRLMLKEGMVFFILLTGVNLLNLVLFRVGTIAAQSSAASLGQAVTMIMSQHIILSLHDWRAISTGSPSSHEMGPVSYAGNGHTTTGGGGGSGGIGGRLRNLGTNRGASQAASPSIPGGHEVYGGTTSSITFEPAVANGGRRGSKHGVSQSPHSRSVVKEFVRSRKGSSEDEHEGPLEIRVQVQEEVKLDYDSVYTDPSDPNYPNSRPESKHTDDRKWGPV